MRYLFQQLGFDVNHEKLGRDGVSSWLIAVKDLNTPWGEKFASYYLQFKFLILYVRHPQDVLPFIVLENEIERSFNFRRGHIIRKLDFDIDEFNSPLEKAIASFLGWNKIVELRSPDLIVKVEDCVTDVVDFVTQHSLAVLPDNISDNIMVDTHINNSLKKFSQPKPEFSVNDYKNIDTDLRVGLLNFCKAYGYDGNFLG